MPFMPVKGQTDFFLESTRQEGDVQEGQETRSRDFAVVLLDAIGMDGRCCWSFPRCSGLRP